MKNMVKNHTLAKAISDVGWSEFVSQLEYKAKWYGRNLVKIDRFYPSSKRCSHCGHILDSLPLEVRQWTCPECGVTHDRDINAAKNVHAVGLTVFEAYGEACQTREGESPIWQASAKQETLEVTLGTPIAFSYGGGCQG